MSKVWPQYLAEFRRQMGRLVRAVRVQTRQRRRPDSGRFDKLLDTAAPMLLSVAYDQVRKMAAHNELSRRTGIAVHFFDPSRPLQRDSSRTPTSGAPVPPKGPVLPDCRREQIDTIADQINRRLRRALGGPSRWRSIGGCCSVVRYTPSLVQRTSGCCTTGLNPQRQFPRKHGGC